MGLIVIINSDDPAYFSGYMEENYLARLSARLQDRAQLHNTQQYAILIP
jgi:adenosine deaminase